MVAFTEKIIKLSPDPSPTQKRRGSLYVGERLGQKHPFLYRRQFATLEASCFLDNLGPIVGFDHKVELGGKARFVDPP